jgi:hypothetical protein
MDQKLPAKLDEVFDKVVVKPLEEVRRAGSVTEGGDGVGGVLCWLMSKGA